MTDIKQISGSKFEGMVGKLKDGSTVSVRTGSSGNISGKSYPTLQINPAKGTRGQKIKIRYE